MPAAMCGWDSTRLFAARCPRPTPRFLWVFPNVLQDQALPDIHRLSAFLRGEAGPRPLWLPSPRGCPPPRHAFHEVGAEDRRGGGLHTAPCPPATAGFALACPSFQPVSALPDPGLRSGVPLMHPSPGFCHLAPLASPVPSPRPGIPLPVFPGMRSPSTVKARQAVWEFCSSPEPRTHLFRWPRDLPTGLCLALLPTPLPSLKQMCVRRDLASC